MITLIKIIIVIACFVSTASFAGVGSLLSRLAVGAEQVAVKEAGLIARLTKSASGIKLAERYGDDVAHKVIQETLICVDERMKHDQKSQTQKNLTSKQRKEQASNKCILSFLKCMENSPNNSKQSNNKSINRCINEVNTKAKKTNRIK